MRRGLPGEPAQPAAASHSARPTASPGATVGDDSAALTRGIYVAGCEPATGKSAVALGLQQLLSRRIGRLGVFRPVSAGGADPLLALLRAAGGDPQASVGVTPADLQSGEARALEEIVARYHALGA